MQADEVQSVLHELPTPMAVVCHDAGATNLIVSWLRSRSGVVRASMQGPAAPIWAKILPGAENLRLEEAMEGAAMLISGTGWASDVEHRARKLARIRGIRSVAVLDHWVNYRERFVREGELVLPDELWVVDDDACTEARACFPQLPIRQLPNLYLERLVKEVATFHPRPARQPPQNVLYVLEPVRQHWGRDDRPGEFQALEFFLGHLPEIGVAADTRIRLRPHPSDPTGKYDDWPGRYSEIDMSIDSDSLLAEQIAWADWVVGLESFALVIALRAKRITISTLPPWAPHCRLPQQNLLHLRDLVAPSA